VCVRRTQHYRIAPPRSCALRELQRITAHAEQEKRLRRTFVMGNRRGRRLTCHFAKCEDTFRECAASRSAIAPLSPPRAFESHCEAFHRVSTRCTAKRVRSDSPASCNDAARLRNEIYGYADRRAAKLGSAAKLGAANTAQRCSQLAAANRTDLLFNLRSV